MKYEGLFVKTVGECLPTGFKSYEDEITDSLTIYIKEK